MRAYGSLHERRELLCYTRRMKSLLAGIVLILVVGIGGFIYRNVAERTGGPEPVACTEEAKMCPDGSSVGRIAPSCEFAPCPFPNITLPDAGLSFVAPEGYEQVLLNPGDDTSVLARFTKPSLSESVAHTLILTRYPIGEGESADEVILAHTRYQPADMQAEDLSQFKTSFVNGREVQHTVIERFEGLVHSAYFIPRTSDVVVIEVIEHDVTDWMEPSLEVEKLPEHQALLVLLSTLQLTP